MNPTVCLVWVTRKRHVAVDGKLICAAKQKSGGYTAGNGQYNSLAISGLPKTPHTGDAPYTHPGGIIDYLPLADQKKPVVTTSICKKCLTRYAALLVKNPPLKVEAES
jgi:hypothetical protein